MKNQKLTYLLSAAVLAALTACGGGGGGDSAAAPGTPTAPVAPVPVILSPIVTTVPAPTYAAASEEVIAFNLLNAERDRCGFGKLTQNAQLDAAAKGHADWLLVNSYEGHYQIAGTPGFTGVSPADRAVAAGYGPGIYGEVEFGQTGAKTGVGAFAVRELLNGPYHMLEMIRGYRDVGVSVREKADVGLITTPAYAVNIDFGYKQAAGPQAAASGTVRTYPCEGTEGVGYSMRGEIPNPVPGRNLRANPLGSSIGISIDAGNTLTIQSASMIKVATGAAIVLRVPITKATDPNGTTTTSYLYSNEGFVSADTPLDPNSKYQVTITGTNNGTVFSRTFTFTTGS